MLVMIQNIVKKEKMQSAGNAPEDKKMHNMLLDCIPKNILMGTHYIILGTYEVRINFDYSYFI
jgi:hypothetical protein